MSIIALDQYDPRNGAYNGTTLNVCRKAVPYVHALVFARFSVQSVVLTGAVTVQLRYADLGGPRGGAILGVELVNADLLAGANVFQQFKFALRDEDEKIAPADRQYFLLFTSGNSADRMDEPTLHLEVNNTPRVP